MIELKRKEIIQYLLNNGKNKSWSEILKQFDVIIDTANLKKVSDYWRYTQRTGKIIPEKSLKDVTTNLNNNAKILIYDIETTYLTARVWNTGKQYIRHDQLTTETKIITVAYTWLNSGEVEYISWDNKLKDDKDLLNEFSKVYNSADAVCGINSDRFDCKILHSRCAKKNIDINTLIPKIDLQKQSRAVFRLPSYSMKYLAQYFGVNNKSEHEGMSMWIKIQELHGEVSEKSLQDMIEYNVNDVITTEEIYNKLLPYFKNKIHFGVSQDKDKFTCPDTGSENVRLYKEITTPSTKQYILISNETGRKYKVSKSSFKKM